MTLFPVRPRFARPYPQQSTDARPYSLFHWIAARRDQPNLLQRVGFKYADHIVRTVERKCGFRGSHATLLTLLFA